MSNREIVQEAFENYAFDVTQADVDKLMIARIYDDGGNPHPVIASDDGTLGVVFCGYDGEGITGDELWVGIPNQASLREAIE